LCVRVSRVSRLCPGSPRCLFTGSVPVRHTAPIGACRLSTARGGARAMGSVETPRAGRAKLYAENELRRAKHEADWQEFVRARSPNARAAERITRALPVVESAPRTPDDRLRTPLEWPRVAIGRVPILLQGGAHLGGPTHLRDQDPEPGMEIERQRRRPLQMRGRRIQLQLVEINRPHAQYPSLSCVSAS
jgi:hypothetical protein